MVVFRIGASPGPRVSLPRSLYYTADTARNEMPPRPDRRPAATRLYIYLRVYNNDLRPPGNWRVPSRGVAPAGEFRKGARPFRRKGSAKVHAPARRA